MNKTTLELEATLKTSLVWLRTAHMVNNKLKKKNKEVSKLITNSLYQTKEALFLLQSQLDSHKEKSK